MAKNYTLNRFYYEAKALLEKHDCADLSYKLIVNFEIEEARKPGEARELKCGISYRKNSDWYYYTNERTPELALDEFEKNILKSKGKNFDIDPVSIDLEDDLISITENS